MAISSPFKKGHSRGGSTATNGSTGSTSMSALAAQYEQDKNKLIKYCFSRHDDHGNIQESYITHVRIVEYEDYPSHKPPSNASKINKKSRVLALAVKKDGTVFLHKGRESSNGTFQIGRSWSLQELTLIKRETASDVGFLARLRKDYYWETNTSKERQVFVTSLVRIYRKFKNGLVPQLINWDLSLFGLDEKSYSLFLNKETLASNPKSRKSSTTNDTSAAKAALLKPSSPQKNKEQPIQPPVVQSMLEPLQPKLESKVSTQAVINERNVTTPVASKVATPKRSSVTSLNKAAASTAAVAAGASAATIAAVTATRRMSNSSPEKQEKERRKSLDPRNSLTPTIYVDSHSSPQKESNNLEEEIQQQIADLTLGSTDSLVETGPPKEFTEVNDASNSSIPLSVSQSVRSIEIIGHRKSHTEYEKEYEEEEEDITELYFSPGSPEQLPVRELTYSINDALDDSQDFSFDQTYDSQKLNTTSDGLKKDFRLDQHESDNDYDILAEEIPKLQGRARVNTLDSFGFEASNIPQAINDSSLVGVFDDIDWDANDDADTISRKLYDELLNTQYNVVKNVIEVKQKAGTLQSFTANAIAECDKITPLLSFFQIELAGFSKSIQHVEAANDGIQVETMNKKNLWRQLQTILNTVSVDDESLKVLLASDIDYDITVIERILADLQSAILEISGAANHDTFDADLGEMRALNDRRKKYESVIGQFLRKIVDDLDFRFKETFGELLNSRSFNSSSISGPLSKLLTYSTLILFAKEMSDDTYDKLIGIWEGSANNFYEQILLNLTRTITHAASQSEKFTLSSQTAFKTRQISTETKSKIDYQQERLKMKLGMLESTTVEEEEVKPKVENPLTRMIFDTFETVQKHLILQQNFILRFFHLSNDDLSVEEYISKYPLNKRLNFLNVGCEEVEIDRENARELYQSITSIFEPEFDTLLKSVVQFLRHSQKNTPTVILYLELFERKYRSSSQEFLLNSFKVISDRLKADWLRFLDNESKTIEKTILAAKKVREVSIYIKNFARLVDDIELNYKETLQLFPNDSKSVNETRELINNSYDKLSKVIVKNLQTGDESKSSVFSIQEVNINKEKINQIINLIQNCNWIVESLSKVPQLSQCITTAKSIYNGARDQYVLGLATEHLGKINVFVNDVQTLVDELGSKGVDPSKRNAYTENVLSKLLVGYNARELNKIVLNVRQVVVDHFDSEPNSVIQKQLIEKIWSAVQAQFVSTTLGLEDLVSRYYRGVELQFSKKDIIAAFNNARL